MKKQFRIVGNWKMNPKNQADARQLLSVYQRLAKSFGDYSFTACVPAVFLPILKRRSGVRLGAQNTYERDSGSFTGALSVPMLRDAGAGEVLIGHSERRVLFGVDNSQVRAKVEHCITHKMPMIVCFGESERDEDGAYLTELEAQLEEVLDTVRENRAGKLLTLAYEPVWAIGNQAKRSIDHDELFSTTILIRNIVAKHLGTSWTNKLPLLYGGSVRASNARELSSVPGINGFLIGRAGLSKEGLESICQKLI